MFHTAKRSFIQPLMTLNSLYCADVP